MCSPRRSATVLLIAACALTLSGCATSTDGFGDLQTQRGSEDELPALAESDAFDNVDISTSRYVGEHDGASLWIAEGVVDAQICLVAVAGESEWGVSCGGAAGVITTGVTGTFMVIPDGVPAPENATKISENVYAGTP